MLQGNELTRATAGHKNLFKLLCQLFGTRTTYIGENGSSLVNHNNNNNQNNNNNHHHNNDNNLNNNTKEYKNNNRNNCRWL